MRILDGLYEYLESKKVRKVSGKYVGLPDTFCPTWDGSCEGEAREALLSLVMGNG